MSGAEWAAMLGAVTTLVTGLGTAFAWLINKIIAQSKETVDEIRKDRDYWRERALITEREDGGHQA